jgi:predicted O-methyltransferase YrrM
MIRQLTERLQRRLGFDVQTRLLLKMAATGARNDRFGLLAAWDRWTAPVAWRWAAARGRNPLDVPQPGCCPSADLSGGDPIAAIMASPDFPAFADFFDVASADEPGLVSAYTQALLYVLVRNLQPDNVVEIGTYRLSTSKVICRALHANGRGMLHTVDPNDGDAIVALIRRWPIKLRERLCFYPMSSMEFFAQAVQRQLVSSLVFVDGNHDYEYALFDIQSAARIVSPGGFIAVDNISQGSPLYAARDFIRERSGCAECGHALGSSPLNRAFDPDRSTIANTDLCVIRAPSRYIVGPRLETSGAQWVNSAKIEGTELSIARPASGTLHAQYVVRIIKPQTTETTAETSIELDDAIGPTRVALPWIFTPDDMTRRRSVELWLGWSGDKELELNEAPVFY